MKVFTFLSLLAGLVLAACSANTPNYMEQGGASWVIGSGGTLTIADGATFALNGADRLVKVKKQALVAAATSGGVLSWVNPTASTIIVERLILDVTTVATGSATVDCGIGSAATTIDDTLIDGLDVNAAVGAFDNISSAGSNGKAVKRLASGEYVTCTQKSGDVTGLVGSAFIHYYAQ